MTSEGLTPCPMYKAAAPSTPTACSGENRRWRFRDCVEGAADVTAERSADLRKLKGRGALWDLC